MVILVMGRAGAGKSEFCKQLREGHKDCAYLNADVIRGMFNDWDFSLTGRLRQARRMRLLAALATNDIVIVDMICPLRSMREIIKPDLVYYVKNAGHGKYKDTDAIFEEPTEAEGFELIIKERE